MKYLVSLWLLLLFSLSLRGNIYFKHLGKSDGLSQISVVSICQDELGRMWFGTQEGLNCYDGHRMRVFKPSLNDRQAFAGNDFRNLVTDGKGNLFFTADGNLVRYDLHADRFIPQQKRTSSLFACDGTVWAAVKDSILKWNPEAGCFEPFYVMNERREISALVVADSTCWIGTKDGLFKMALQGQQQPVCILPKIHVHSLYSDSRGCLWVAAYRGGMYRVEHGMSQRLDTQPEFALSNNDVRCFTEDQSGNIWVGTFNGLNRITPDGTMTSYRKGTRPGELTHSSIFSLYRDQQGTIWVGTYYGGVNYFNPEADIFHHYAEANEGGNGLSFPYVGHMAEDKRGGLWICTEGGGLNFLDRQSGRFEHYLVDAQGASNSFYNLKCIAYNPNDDCLYVGTHKQGLLCFDVATKRVLWNLAKGDSFDKLEYREGKLYLLSIRGLYVMEPSSRTMKPLFPDVEEANRQALDFLFDSQGYCWLAGWHHLLRINMSRPDERTTYDYDRLGQSQFRVQKMAEMADGTLFFGTCGNGIYYYNRSGDEFVPCSSLDVNYCYYLTVVAGDCLVASTDRGLLFYHPLSGQKMMVDADTQLHLSSFNDGCGLCVSRDGELFVGGVEGMSSFKVEQLLQPAPEYKLFFSSLMVNGKEVVVGAHNGILPQAMPLAKRIDLRHNENNFALTFTSNDYVNNARSRVYAYKLVGFNREWTVTYGNTVAFTNLNPGNYRLVVREQPSSSKAKVPSIAIPIVIHCAWWESWWAFLLYLALLTTGLTFVIRNWRARLLLRAQLAREKMEKEQNEAIIQAKLQFFANVSHEFRTPVTLIISQLESLLQTPSLAPTLRMKLQKVYRNTFHFRELISELLDFRKMERGKLTLHVAPVEMVAYLRQIYQDFCDQAQLQNLHFEFTPSVEQLTCWCDARQLRKVFTNLLTNAFKFTPEGGKVEIQVDEIPEGLCVKVIDSGKGIPEEALPHIFERFYQAESSAASSGSGIGLALTKGLIEMHHGRIYAQSAPEYGSIFTVELPKENPFLNDPGVIIEKEVAPVVPDVTLLSAAELAGTEASGRPSSAEAPGQLSSDEAADEQEKPCVLVVEDNEDLLQILTALLSPLYRVCLAMNGQEGIDRAQEVHPYLILSDVMMPVMDGITMCRKIKANFDICHIPVVMLTALTSDNSKMEGLQCGADDYIEKPFSNKMLLGRIANMLRNRRLLKQKFSRELAAAEKPNEETIQALALTPMDAAFLKKLEQVVSEHLADADFDVNKLASELALSRSSLYNKLKALSTVSPNEYILDVRLRHAAELLKTRFDLQITDIAFQTGFSSLRYFRHCFKARYNQTPQEYRGAK